MQERSIVIRSAQPGEFVQAAQFWALMRRELAMSDTDLAPDWEARAVAYFDRRYRADELRWFFAYDDSRAVASASGFLLDGYPSEMCTRRRIGYIAGVYVMPGWRRLGLAREVTRAAVEWLWEIGCRLVRLHAAHEARAIYKRMGFEPSNEMIMERPATLRPPGA